MRKPTRREFLKRTALGAGASVLLPGFLGGCARALGAKTASVPANPWDQLPAILARIVAPVFPARDFDVQRYGAVGDGVKDCSAAFAAAIQACNAAGGGRVTVTPGRISPAPSISRAT
jgi:Endopolygalacturonase